MLLIILISYCTKTYFQEHPVNPIFEIQNMLQFERLFKFIVYKIIIILFFQFVFMFLFVGSCFVYLCVCGDFLKIILSLLLLFFGGGWGGRVLSYVLM